MQIMPIVGNTHCWQPHHPQPHRWRSHRRQYPSSVAILSRTPSLIDLSSAEILSTIPSLCTSLSVAPSSATRFIRGPIIHGRTIFDGPVVLGPVIGNTHCPRLIIGDEHHPFPLHWQRHHWQYWRRQYCPQHWRCPLSRVVSSVDLWSVDISYADILSATSLPAIPIFGSPIVSNIIACKATLWDAHHPRPHYWPLH